MKLSLKKLTAGGFSHVVVPLLAVVIVAGVGTYFLVASHAAPLPCNRQVFGQGSSGACVTDIQKIVRDFATHESYGSYFKYSSRAVVNPSSFIDGQYGPNTAGQVKNFQNWFPGVFGKKGVDGVVGPTTWRVLCS